MNDSLNLETIPEKLNPKQKSAFFDVFWRTWSTNGFGTLTKKDTELLIFSCLKKAFGDKGPSSNFEWATLLRLTPAKIKSMRLEAHLRFGHLFDEDGLSDTKAFLDHFGELQSIDIQGMMKGGSVEDVTVSFVVEDPVVQMVIENSLKRIGTYLDFHRNKEVIKLRLVDFFRLVADDKQKQNALDRWVKAKAKEKADGESLRARVSARDYAQKTELDKAMTFIDDLADFANVKKLTDHLKLIFRSQEEHNK